MQITETVIKVNEEIKDRMIQKLLDLVEGSFNGKIVVVLGVTFKPNTDDMRASPALKIVPAMIGGGAKVRVVDPQGRHEGESQLPGVQWAEDAYKAAQNADLIVILTQWNEFRALDLKKIAKKMNTPKLADLRNIYSERDAKKAGFEAYVSVGRRDYFRTED
jgi:UDPglucose 6-dehydrogenase